MYSHLCLSALLHNLLLAVKRGVSRDAPIIACLHPAMLLHYGPQEKPSGSLLRKTLYFMPRDHHPWPNWAICRSLTDTARSGECQWRNGGHPLYVPGLAGSILVWFYPSLGICWERDEVRTSQVQFLHRAGRVTANLRGLRRKMSLSIMHNLWGEKGLMTGGFVLPRVCGWCCHSTCVFCHLHCLFSFKHRCLLLYITSYSILTRVKYTVHWW